MDNKKLGIHGHLSGALMYKRCLCAHRVTLGYIVGGSAHTPNLLFGKDPGNLRDARNSQSPVVNHRVLDECTNVRWSGSCIVSLVAYMCII